MLHGVGVTIRVSGEAAICAAGAINPPVGIMWNEPFSKNTEYSALNA